MKWLGHVAAILDKEIKGTVTSPEFTDEETLLAMNVGLATLKEIFKISEGKRSEPGDNK